MPNFGLKNTPILTLTKVLNRRKTSLKSFINDMGFQTYQSLVNWCNIFGVQPPSEQEFKTIIPDFVTSLQDGVVVLEPLEEIVEEKTVVPVEVEHQKKKSSKKRKSSFKDDDVNDDEVEHVQSSEEETK